MAEGVAGLVVEGLFYAIVFPGLGFAVTTALLLQWFYRKLSARLQGRVGPRYAGPLGLFQGFYDLFKLLSKEETVPLGSDDVLVGASLVWAVVLSTIPLLFVPWLGSPVFPLQGWSLLVSLASLTLAHGVLFIASHGSSGVYSVIGGLRLLGLAVSSEIVYGSSLLAAHIAAGCTGLPVYVARCAAAVLGFVGLLAVGELNPFTVAEAETEVAGGVYAEFSGRRLGFALLARDIHRLASLSLYVCVVAGAPWGLRGVAAFAALAAVGLAVYAGLTLVDALTPRARLRDAEQWLVGVFTPLSLAVLGFASLLAGCRG